MPPWLRDENGEDIFAGGIGDPAVIDTTETFGDNPVTRWIDDTDDGIRETVPQTPAEWGGAFVDASTRATGTDGPWLPEWDDPLGDTSASLQTLVKWAPFLVALFALAPVLRFGTEVLDE